LRVARTVVLIHGREYCPVWNDTNEPRTLKYGTPLATVLTIQDKLEACFLKDPIQEYGDAKSKRNVHEISNFHSKNNRRHSHANDTRHSRHNTHGSYANDRRQSYATSAGHLYADHARNYQRRSYANDTRRSHAQDTNHFKATDAPSHNREPNEGQNSLVQNANNIHNRDIPHTTNIPHTTEIPNTIGGQHTTNYNSTIQENKLAPAAITNMPQINKNTKPSGMTTPATTRTMTPNHEPAVYQSRIPNRPIHVQSHYDASMAENSRTDMIRKIISPVKYLGTTL